MVFFSKSNIYTITHWKRCKYQQRINGKSTIPVWIWQWIYTSIHSNLKLLHWQIFDGLGNLFNQKWTEFSNYCTLFSCQLIFFMKTLRSRDKFLKGAVSWFSAPIFILGSLWAGLAHLWQPHSQVFSSSCPLTPGGRKMRGPGNKFASVRVFFTNAGK